MSPSNSTDAAVPSSIIIVGSGVFGLSTADALCQRPEYKGTKIVVIDRTSFPAFDAGSIDCSRIVRPDYAHPGYAALAVEAQQLWRGKWGAENRYHEVGLLATGHSGKEDYLNESLKNVQQLWKIQKSKGIETNPNLIEPLGTHEQCVAAAGTGGANGDVGYLNRGSGWADAESSMRWLRKRVMAYKRVGFMSVGVEKLIFDAEEGVVAGVETCDGNYFSADLIILAAGAWTPSLVDLRGRVAATGHALGYVEITPEEAEVLSKTPVQFSLSNGCFHIPPPPPTKLANPPSMMNKGQFYLKVACHDFGYLNPVTIKHPEDPSKGDITVSLPHTTVTSSTSTQPVPKDTTDFLAHFLKTIIPPTSPLKDIAERPFALTRLCHYADTPTAEFLIDYHPNYKNSLFIATGDSGHGFKFLPVIGEKIVDCIEGNVPRDFEGLWSWNKEPEDFDVGKWKLEGSRSGERGLVLREELEKSGLKM